MNLQALIETKYTEQIEEFSSCPAFRALEDGRSPRAAYDGFIAGICRTHLKSPHILAFLYAVAPPAAADSLKHNMLEEMGLDEEGRPHPALLLELAAAAGLAPEERVELERTADDRLRRIISDPILFGTLKEVGLNVLLETVAFEWMLARLAGRIADFLERHRRISRDGLEWFAHHSEVDIRHAAEGLQAIADYVEYYDFHPSDLETILDVTFRENVFLKRYFAGQTLGRAYFELT